MLGLLYKFVLAELCFSVMTLFQVKNFLQLAGYAYSYGAYMFFDFAGYSLMAVGTGYMFGILVPDNFHKPFISKDMKEFWARWHISLSEWFRDFVVHDAVDEKEMVSDQIGGSFGRICGEYAGDGDMART